MSYRAFTAFAAALSTCLLAPACAFAQDGLADEAFAVLRRHCYRCHGENGLLEAGLNVLDHGSLLEGAYYVVAEKPADSLIWKRVLDEVDPMPPKNVDQRPTPEELDVLEQWIKAGAPAFAALRVIDEPIRESDVWQTVATHLRAADEATRPFLRYFSFAHLYNNEGYSEKDLRLYRAALAKLLNSLTWQGEIVQPAPIDEAKTIYAIDLRALAWDVFSLRALELQPMDLWQKMLVEYPYGLTHDEALDQDLQAAYRDAKSMSQTRAPFVRGDWFVATASRPPLYHTLLQLPETVQELESRLQVNVEQDFLDNKLQRAGFLKSGVSSFNRLVDRHVIGAYDLGGSPAIYWKSYDFGRNGGRGDIRQFPLGPPFGENPFSSRAFNHDGGEIIFNLPNGMQAYYLATSAGDRLDEAPAGIVSDRLKTAGTAEVVNGLSCIACHSQGMRRFQDRVVGPNRNNPLTSVRGEFLEKSLALYTPIDEMNTLLDEDTKTFVQAVRQATAGMLEENEGFSDREEPIGVVARLYQQEVSLAEAALEIGVRDPLRLKYAVAGNSRLREIGLTPFKEGEPVAREVWQQAVRQVCQELELGSPFTILR